MKLETDADQLKEELASADKLPFKVGPETTYVKYRGHDYRVCQRPPYNAASRFTDFYQVFGMPETSRHYCEACRPNTNEIYYHMVAEDGSLWRKLCPTCGCPLVTNGQENMRGCYNFDCKDRMWIRFTPAPPADASDGQQKNGE